MEMKYQCRDIIRVCCFAVEYPFNRTANTNNIVHCLRISGVSNVPLSLARGVYFLLLKFQEFNTISWFFRYFTTTLHILLE